VIATGLQRSGLRPQNPRRASRIIMAAASQPKYDIAVKGAGSKLGDCKNEGSRRLPVHSLSPWSVSA
jgi:hypothetical protein